MNIPQKPKRPTFSNTPQEGSEVAEMTSSIPAPPGTPPRSRGRSPALHAPNTPPTSPTATVHRNT